MHKLKTIITAFIPVIITSVANAQTVDQAAANTGAMASNGKIYVVMAIVITILAGLIIYVARLDRKISRLEKEGV